MNAELYLLWKSHANGRKSKELAKDIIRCQSYYGDVIISKKKYRKYLYKMIRGDYEIS
jgi:hypothetical protein